jgi:hypothetical protein
MDVRLIPMTSKAVPADRQIVQSPSVDHEQVTEAPPRPGVPSKDWIDKLFDMERRSLSDKREGNRDRLVHVDDRRQLIVRNYHESQALALILGALGEGRRLKRCGVLVINYSFPFEILLKRLQRQRSVHITISLSRSHLAGRQGEWRGCSLNGKLALDMILFPDYDTKTTVDKSADEGGG